MYEYRFYNTLSTKPSTIYDEDSTVIGTISKKYTNPAQKLLDMLLKGRFFVKYEIKDSTRIVFKSKREPNPFKKRQYYINYYKDVGDRYIHLIDKKSFDIGERTAFEYNGETYELEKSAMDWARIKKDGNVIAEWKSSLKIPFVAYFKMVDKNFNEDKLLLLGLFHTYLHAP